MYERCSSGSDRYDRLYAAKEYLSIWIANNYSIELVLMQVITVDNRIEGNKLFFTICFTALMDDEFTVHTFSISKI